MRERAFLLAAVVLMLTCGLEAQPDRNRALLVGINDYSASGLPVLPGSTPVRNWSDLDGAIHDVQLMRDLLVTLYRFQKRDIVTLTDQQATRGAILRSLEQLAAETKKGDVVLFYFSGHGSQVRNSLSDEADSLDESLVPADSRRGALDVRDKELRPYFNRILDRGGRLTVILDACHSGSGARNGLDNGLRQRGIDPDPRDVRDPSNEARPEEHGALILSATEDFDLAFEIRDDRKNIRGAFTWALARAMRDADAGEPARDTFLRARAWLHIDRPAQYPVMAGNEQAQLRPLFGVRTDRRDQRAVIAVEQGTRSRTYVLQGGWANGVTVGSELRLLDCDDVRLEVTALIGIAHCEARVSRGTATLKPGTLFELAAWAAPPSPPLRVWIPRAEQIQLTAALALRVGATRRGIKWVEDPTETTPKYLLRWSDGAWELVTAGRRTKLAVASLGRVPSNASLFVQLPVPPAIADAIGEVDGVERTSGPQSADYILTGRLVRDRIEYSWVQPLATADKRARNALPLRTAWTGMKDGFGLRVGLERLRRVQGWHALPSPAASGSHYRLAFRRTDGTLVEDGKLVGENRYQLVLRERQPRPSQPLYARYLYAFVIDSDGRGVLLFPRPDAGAVENLLPITVTPGQALRQPPAEVPLVGVRPFVVGEPYGEDTYFLLSTEEPLPNLAGLDWEGLRAPGDFTAKTPLEALLAMTLAGTRSPNDEAIRTPPTWSIDKVVFQSVPPKRTAR